MTPISVEEANGIIEEIMLENGGIDDETRKKTPIQTLKSLKSLRQKLAAATSTLAKELYSKDTRFVFELIQNAEDNHYTVARSRGTRPFLRFLVLDAMIQIDSNEDGFGPGNVKAICSVGESTKTTTQGYIGEKGIGFKSVFKLASRVQVQSGPFCFSFRNGKEDDGLGMVTPYIEEPEELPPDTRTRFTLILHDAFQYSQRVKDFEQLPETLPLFLTQLKDIKIIFGGNNKRQERHYSYELCKNGQLGKLEVANISESGARTISTQCYHVIKRTAQDLPRAEARGNNRQAEVILAFPVDENGYPKIESQHVFAFLPLRKDGFSFIIQSDFITQASREDIVHNPWNEALRDHVAHAFKDAILRFCQDEQLCTTWMRYLPTTTTSDFWKPLKSKIASLLESQRILKPWSGGTLRLPSDLKWLTSDARDEHNEPLFRDNTNELYLSKSYNWSDFETLRDTLSAKTIHVDDIIERVKADLSRPDSFIKGDTKSADWHTRSASLLCKLYDINTSLSVKVRNLAIIPLQDGSWSSGQSSIYYPLSDMVPIPTDLGLRLIEKSALANKARRQLFTKLGAQDLAPSSIVKLIIGKYNKPRSVTRESSVSHIRYLYYFDSEKQDALDKRICIFDDKDRPIYRAYVTFGQAITVDDLYFETDDEFGVKELCKRPLSPCGKYDYFHPVHFIHPSYLSAVPATARVQDRSWMSWLHIVAEVRRVPRLTLASDPTKLSPISEAIVENSPGKIVGWLHEYWKSDYDDIVTPEVVDTLRGARVSCQGSSSEFEKLCYTYLPTTELTEICTKLGFHPSPVPFLELAQSLHKSNYGHLHFLSTFGVNYKPCLSFYLDVVQAFASADVCSYPPIKDVRDMYEGIERYSNAENHDLIREFFEDDETIYIPAITEGSGEWVTSSHCVWKAPDFLTTRHSLARTDMYGGSKHLRTLFTIILEISDAGWHDYLAQLKAWTGTTALHKDVKAAYSLISQEACDEAALNTIRSEFEAHALIYLLSQDQWHPRSSCLWTDQTVILGKAAIKSDYSHLSDFFVKKLGVKEPSLGLYVKELKSLCKSKTAPLHSEVRDLLQEINACKPSAEDLSPLQSLDFLPIKDVDTTVRLKSTSDLFTIIDREEHERMFRNLVATLDYDMENVHKLRYLIVALGLQDKYSHAMASESTSAKNSSKSIKLTNNFQRKAYALFRCAVHFGKDITYSADDPLYGRLLHTEVYKSEDIVKTTSLSLKGNVLATQDSPGTFHLQEDEKLLRLYVPHNQRLQELCYITQIPRRLALLFSAADPAAAEKILGDVLKASPVILDDVLVAKGIIQISGVNPLPEEVESRSRSVSEASFQGGLASEPQDNPSVTSDDESTVIESQDSVYETSSFTSRDNTPFSEVSRLSTFMGGNIAASQASAISRHFTSLENTPFKGVSRLPPFVGSHVAASQASAISRNQEYCKLLGQIIQAAGRIKFPDSQTTRRATADGCDASKISLQSCFGNRAENPLEHDIRVGAAGELFVFEYLLQNELPDFGINNWKSSIRHTVSVHDKYRDLTPWRGAETADIVYDDTDSRMTSVLIARGYLDLNTWAGQCPKYYLEVKTTTGDYDARFYASKAQYKRMGRTALTTARTSPEIYVIFRVFYLGEQEIGFRVLVDPKGLERQGALEFEAETYTVFQRDRIRDGVRSDGEDEEEL